MKSSKFTSEIRQARDRAKEYVDLHMHSTFSDGTLPVRELIDHCVDQGLSAMAITDHDNIDAFEEVWSQRSGGTVVIPFYPMALVIGSNDYG